ncbi:oxidoreductase [Paenibacillus psychroresistens]|uniref:Oxidoreductase n=1 Tax=Paenibacillus psychroresistens TaxID=1778678 RepID=A0A6B8RSS3_9BACL|nr:molybdopterin-dependent oxidoreductase [Paenibacillus psychroresistens]QGQ98864.1 oxidoreductase [Paenibacillus psychroresistens]
MSTWKKWLKPPIGKFLVQLHKWNAWVIVLLTISGIVLSIGSIRGDLGAGRVWLKQIHIWAGVLSTILLIIYLPRMRKHLKQLRNKPGQKFNLSVVLFLLVGWIISGIILWQGREFTPRWNTAALAIHDIFTWVGIPYALFHSITRSRWVKEPTKRTIKAEEQIIITENGKIEVIRPVITGKPFYTRREFLRWGVGVGTVIIVGPMFIKWLSSNVLNIGSGDVGGVLTEADGSPLRLAPVPLADSVAVIGGGAEGRFRIYTVTPIPKFHSETWNFYVKGLVDKPLEFNWAQFLELKRKVQVSDFHCVTGWSVYHNTWEGIPLSAMLEMAGVQSKGKFVKFYSGDGVYTDCLSLDVAKGEDIMIAVMHDGKPISADLGGPVRLIVPQMFAYKSVKWLQGIELIEEDHFGYWEVRGYDNDAWVKA